MAEGAWRARLKSVGSGQAGFYTSSTMYRLCRLENSISACISLPIRWERIMVPFSLGCYEDSYK